MKFAFWPEDHSVYYPCYETGGQFWSAGKDMYAPRVCPVDFRYGPAAAMALAPFAALPTWLGGLLWIWLNLGVFFASLWALMRRILPGRWTPQRQGIYLGLVLLGAARSLWSGQSNLLIFAMVGMAAAALLENRCWKAAWLLAIPVHIKAWPLAAGLLLSACRPRALAARLGACLLGVAASPFLTKPFALVCRRYYGWFVVLTGRAAVDRHTYRDAWTIWEQFQGHVPHRLYLAVQLASAAIVVGLCLWQARRSLSAQRLLLFVLVVWACWQLVFGPATERNTFGLLAPLTSWALITAFEEKRGRVVMSLAFVLTCSATFGVTERWLQTVFPWALLAHPIGTLLLAGWFLTWNARTGQTDAAVIA